MSNFNYTNLSDTSWEDAFRDAIKLYQTDSLDSATADALGTMVANLARWSINEAIKKHLLYTQMRDDADFRGDVMCEIYSKMPKVDTRQHAKRVLGLLKTVADHAIINHIRYSSRLKRQHEDVTLDDVTICCDLYGDRIL